jgi:hypothetical protein
MSAALPPLPNNQNNPAGAIPVYNTHYAATPVALSQMGLAVTAAAEYLTVPMGARFAFITVEGGPVRWRDDGTPPTIALGQYVAPGSFWYYGDLAMIQFILATATAATIDVSYYK